MAKHHFVSACKKKAREKKRENSKENSKAVNSFRLLTAEKLKIFKVNGIKDVKAKFYCGDALEFIEVLKKEEEKVHLVLTSPPYNAGLDYDSYNDCKEWEDYLNWLCLTFQKVYEVVVPGGRVVLNVPYVIRFNREKRTFVQKDYEKVLERAGFEVKDLVVWVKARSEEEAIQYACRNAAWGSWLSPKNPVFKPIHELLIIAQKEGEFELSGEVDLTKEEFKSWTKSVWFIPPASHKVHPAVFPEELVKRVVKLFTTKKQTVFDPFAGVGTTLKVALLLERNALGSEVSPLYFYEGVKSLRETVSYLQTIPLFESVNLSFY